MSCLLSHILIRLSLVLAIGVGLVGAGFAHRTAAPLDAQMLAFLEMGGTLDDLCDDGAPITHLGRSDCEACRLTDAAYAPTPVAVPRAVLLALSYVVVVPGFEGPVTPQILSDHAARAPPPVARGS